MMLTALVESVVKINPDVNNSRAILFGVSWLTETLQNTGQRIVAHLETETSSLICTDRELIAWDGHNEQRAAIGLIKKVARDNEELVVSGPNGVLIRLTIDVPKEELGIFFKNVKQASLSTQENVAHSSAQIPAAKLEPAAAAPQPIAALAVAAPEVNANQASLGRGAEVKPSTRLSDFSDPLYAPPPKTEIAPRATTVKNTLKSSREPIPLGNGVMQHPDGFNFEYASRLQRFVASFGDSFIFGFVNRFIDNIAQGYVRDQGKQIAVLYNQVKRTQDPVQLEQLKRMISDLPSAAINSTIIATVSTVILAWIYYAYFESGERQGTPGKMWQRIGVTNFAFNRLSFLQSSKRFFWRILPILLLSIPAIELQKIQLLNKMSETSDIQQPVGLMIVLILGFMLLLVDYIFIFFSKRNQTLHDLLSGTIVVKA